MDPYSPILIREAGLKGMIGKGNRSREVIEVMKEQGSVYFAAIGGAGALLSEHILESEIVCYEELGPEAIRKLTVEDMPLIVAIDLSGNNLYESGPDMYKSVF
jgi:fumarate hydratase subunit beta